MCRFVLTGHEGYTNNIFLKLMKKLKLIKKYKDIRYTILLYDIIWIE